MATKAETQAYFDAVANPPVLELIGPGSLAAGSKAFAQRAGLAMQQIALLQALLQMAEIVEDDPELSALFEEQTSRLGAIIRSLQEHHRVARSLRGQLRDFMRQDATMREKAAAAGYTV